VSFDRPPSRGARVLPEGGVRFSVWAPRAERVAVRLPGPAGAEGAEAREEALLPSGDGVFESVVEDAGAGRDYVFVLDDERERPDPASRHQPAGVAGPSRVVDPRRFAWSDAGWRGVARADLVIYELHVGTFSDAGTFEGAIPFLPALRELGVTALELMPVAEFPGGRNWGYDGVFPWAAQSTYGGPEGLAKLVDAAHGAGLAVLLDVVYNHLGPEGNVLSDFGPYFTDRYRTPWGDAINFDGPDSDEVRRYFLENALVWLRDHHLDGLRLDAVHAICDRSARPFLGELADALRGLEAELGRTLHVIAESDDNDPRLVRDPERGGLGLSAVWSDDFHHAVHAALTGERRGYYADFGGVEPVAKAMSDRFVYDGVRSEHRRRRHGAPALDVPAERFVVCVQNHDQVGNRAYGERLTELLPPAKRRLATALLLLSPYVPLLFMGEEYGETHPFLYFVSHSDPGLVEAVRRGRRAEFASFAWSGEVPDPAAEESFRRSRLDRSRERTPEGAATKALHEALLRLRREEPALRPGAASPRVGSERDAGWLWVRRADAGRPCLAAFHLGAAKAELPLPAEGAPWRLRLSTEDAAFGGSGVPLPERIEAADPRLLLPPDAAVVYAGTA